MLSMTAVAIYAAVCMICAAAHYLSARRGASADVRRVFAFAAATFAVMVVLRAFGIETIIHYALKNALTNAGEYSQRRSFQAPVVVVGLMVIFAYAFFKAYRLMQPRGGDHRANMASVASLGMIGLVFVRTASWHTTDVMLYGTLHLNWLLDLGFTLTVGISAALHVCRPKRADRHRQHFRR